jgi:hypothetical protein
MIILINGPPSSGKDTATGIMKKYLTGSVREYKMSSTLKTGLRELLGIEDEQWKRLLEYKKKDMPLLPEGNTPRRALIELSEMFMKPMFGNDIFGHIAVRRIKRMASADHILVSDVGFTYEVAPMLEEWGPKKIRILMLTRPDCDFVNNSRSYLNIDQLKMGAYYKSINNQYDLEMFEAQVKKVLREWELIDDGTQ